MVNVRIGFLLTGPLPFLFLQDAAGLGLHFSRGSSPICIEDDCAAFLCGLERDRPFVYWLSVKAPFVAEEGSPFSNHVGQRTAVPTYGQQMEFCANGWPAKMKSLGPTNSLPVPPFYFAGIIHTYRVSFRREIMPAAHLGIADVADDNRRGLSFGC